MTFQIEGVYGVNKCWRHTPTHVYFSCNYY